MSYRFRPHIEQIASLLAAEPNLYLLIVGHTDASGSADYNYDLSKRRAESVRRMLVVDYGTPPARVIAYGEGENRPLYPDPYNERNRRVEFRQR